ncbi:2-octaprenyl-6-methoxyphenol hydroxylase [Hasllibacter halocynthiae]|uniref:2-octaprenyl-6-methoxyphenol hydroxylase n=1 Tax=Hasllibacter halocynthiae TaxID=595589 RepID=A0A2T0X6B0_9RHOB|nr:FAD-dependent monooxygenase [Hasllibacter halocynthiae]PRY94466.1 2-octaprenyl-6-methoxyphenol hydroxylase [Hasllibacter halocynthiae]
MEHGIDILVAGAGPAGLTAACAFTGRGLQVALADPAPAGAERVRDRRTTAILQPGRTLLEGVGAWDTLGAPAPLAAMRVVDLRANASAGFEAREVGEEAFGWNIPNGALRAALEARASALGVERIEGSVEGVTARTGEAIVRVAGRALSVRLLIGADGRESVVREALGIPVRNWRTGQRALSFDVRHAVPHSNVSTELYDRDGPFVLVPLPDEGGAHRSAVVWMTTGPEAERLLALPADAFAAAATERSGGTLGALEPEGRPSVFPLVTRVAARMAAPRAALIAEAAHALPPIGAQGLNTSLGDVASLLEAAGEDPGEPEALRRWERARMPQVMAKAAAVTALNAASIGGPLGMLRGPAIAAMARAPGLRRGLMRFGLG